MEENKRKKQAVRQIKNLIKSLVIGFLFFSLLCILIQRDDMIECRLIYGYFEEVRQECILTITNENGTYDIEPELPTEHIYPGAWFEITYDIPKEALKADRFHLELMHKKDTAELSSMEFYYHNLQVAKYSPTDIKELFESDGNEINLDYAAFYVTSKDDKIYLDGNAVFLNEYNAMHTVDRPAYLNCLLYAVCVSLIVFLILYRRDTKIGAYADRTAERKYSAWELILGAGLLVIFVTTCIMSFWSKHYSHCDEQMHRFAADYYLGKWFPPTRHSSWTAGTYSFQYGDYGGVSRLNGESVYYFLAGKVGWFFREFFHVETYYRMIGLLLIAIILYLCWKMRRECKWAVLAVCLTPQIWEQFACVASDQFDWFCSFLILILVLNKGSILYKAIGRKTSWYKIIGYATICALLFAQIFLGKDNYLVILGMAFIELVGQWFERKEQKLKIVLIYFLILGLTFVIKDEWGKIPRKTDDRAYVVQEYENRQTQQQQIDPDLYAQKEVQYADYFKDRKSVAPRDNGYTFWDTMMNYSKYMPTPGLVFQSATGAYVTNRLVGPTVYYVVLILLYLVLGAYMLYGILKTKNWIMRIQSVFAIGLMFASFIAALVYCWTDTYQPQGRYVLTIFILIPYVCAHVPIILEKKYFRITSLACFLLCLCEFYYSGLYVMFQWDIMM